MKKIKVDLGKRSYPILIGRGLLDKAGVIIKGLSIGKRAFIITNKKIKGLYGKRLTKTLRSKGMDAKFCLVPDSEKAKSIKIWISTIERLAEFDKAGDVFVIALGGGVVGDLSGFVACSYRRGVPLIQIPTTLLAQVDSAIGGKVALDLEFGKNLVGAFYQTRAVISDVEALKTLPIRDIRNGMAEIIKYGIIMDKGFFAYIENNLTKLLKLDFSSLTHVVATCSRLKAIVVSADERETSGYRSILNLGHTVGHALEAASSYSKMLAHGEAVALGILVACDIACDLNLLEKRQAQKIESLLKSVPLPLTIKGLRINDILKAASHDKKIIRGKRRFVLPTRIGHVIVSSNIEEAVIRKAIKGRMKA